MNTKLTLRLDEDVIIRIKNYANKERQSLSKFTENLFRQILDSSEDSTESLSPIVKKYRGIITDNSVDDSKLLLDQLTEKHS